MLRRIAQISNLGALLGTVALAGCASVQTTDEYARANRWRPLELEGTQYFCRRELPEVPSSPWAGVKCVTRRQLLTLKATDEYAISLGYRPTVIRQTQYYCRGEHPEVSGSTPSEGDCLTRADVRAKAEEVPKMTAIPWRDPAAGVVIPPAQISLPGYPPFPGLPPAPSAH